MDMNWTRRIIYGVIQDKLKDLNMDNIIDVELSGCNIFLNRYMENQHIRITLEITDKFSDMFSTAGGFAKLSNPLNDLIDSKIDQICNIVIDD